MVISDKIIEILDTYSSQTPLKRKDLLLQLTSSGINISDREMRRICAEELPVLSNNNGYYLAKTTEDIEKFYICLRKKAIAMFRRAKYVKKEFISGHKLKDIKFKFEYSNDGQGIFL